ncbi:MAG: hypothetical protein ACJAWZ_003542, partial [Paracoccaceae bacterium]
MPQRSKGGGNRGEEIATLQPYDVSSGCPATPFLQSVKRCALMEYVRSLRPQNSPEFNEAWSLLRASDRTRIAHLDAGLAAHEGIGWMPGAPIPANLRVAEGRNVFDAQINGDAPLTRMTLSNGLAAGMIE